MRKILAGVAVAALSLGLAVSAEAANNPPKIGLVQIDLSNPFISARLTAPRKRRAGPAFS